MRRKTSTISETDSNWIAKFFYSVLSAMTSPFVFNIYYTTIESMVATVYGGVCVWFMDSFIFCFYFSVRHIVVEQINDSKLAHNYYKCLCALFIWFAACLSVFVLHVRPFVCRVLYGHAKLNVIKIILSMNDESKWHNRMKPVFGIQRLRLLDWPVWLAGSLTRPLTIWRVDACVCVVFLLSFTRSVLFSLFSLISLCNIICILFSEWSDTVISFFLFFFAYAYKISDFNLKFQFDRFWIHTYIRKMWSYMIHIWRIRSFSSASYRQT